MTDAIPLKIFPFYVELLPKCYVSCFETSTDVGKGIGFVWIFKWMCFSGQI